MTLVTSTIFNNQEGFYMVLKEKKHLKSKGMPPLMANAIDSFHFLTFP